MTIEHGNCREFLVGMGLSAAAMAQNGTPCAAKTRAQKDPHVPLNPWSVGAKHGRDKKRGLPRWHG